MVNLKARDDAALGRFWAAVLDWVVFHEGPGSTALGPAGFAWPDPDALCLDVVAVPDPEAVRGRVRLDLAAASATHQAELVARLVASGAKRVGGGDEPWTTLTDPEGNVFRVRRETDRDTGPIAAVVVGCADPRAMARFWGTAMAWTTHEARDDRARLRAATGIGPYLEFVPDPLVTRNRFHLDLTPSPRADHPAEVARLRTLGAADADIGQGAVPWAVLADPEGNRFCVLTR
ncbi:hypothetical protein CLV40_101562 [Actinokineospora auranticolor]|uniref:Glyoxalase-like domain-containing protein n=2 Tax=Actinokineospora auranticolor TaxID=155976 RepID=A0A2S6H1M7_9PSEU|nr:hypothetical protein CLV40_101562 [Actinokineospora auranticolor]